MVDDKTKDTVKEIKQSFRLLMNGVTAQSLREKGLDYHLNWGASLLHLREMAAEYAQDHSVAQELWKEDVRECKILATMLMPVEGFDYSLAMLWIEQTRTQEIAEIACMNLYCRLPFAKDLALQLVSSANELKLVHGFNILSRLFAGVRDGNEELSVSETNEFLDQALCSLQEEKVAVRHSAMNAIQRFADIDEECYMLAKGALKTIKMEDWLI